MARGWPRLDALAYGADYNPEQWPERVWAEDIRLMRQAGVNLVTVGVFAWAMLEPRPEEFDFGWLDRVIDLLHDGGIRVDLATPTAAPPPWFLHAHPEARPVTRDGVVAGGGSRQTYCPSSPAYAKAATRITEQLARRYGRHPALVLWHVNNEYGTPADGCYCAQSAAAFREWLRDRYGDLDSLNEHWGTAVWSQRYGVWEEIDAPRVSTAPVNESQRLDFARFSSDTMLACFRRERDILHRFSPDVPVTTNFMAHKSKGVDYWTWAREVDVVANDHYLIAESPDNHIDLAMSADLTRSLAGGRPWLLMEHSTSAVSWQRRNIAKRPGEMRRNSMAHLARGADGLLFFQWRASRHGVEKFHSAMVPHAGTDTRIWREVVWNGQDTATLSELRGSRVAADLAVIFDWESWWALETERRPSVELNHIERTFAYYKQLWQAGFTVDFVHPQGDLSGYRMVVAPSLYLATPAAVRNLRHYLARGGVLVVSYFSGVVDDDNAVQPADRPDTLAGLLGITVEEWLPLPAGARVRLIEDADSAGWTGWADTWAESIQLAGAVPVLRYADGPASGAPAATRHRVGAGQAWYLSTRPDAATLRSLLDRICVTAEMRPQLSGGAEGVELVCRANATHRFLFAINHGDTARTIRAHGVELLSGAFVAEELTVPAGGSCVVRSVR